MNILGIDLSSTNIGWCVFNCEERKVIRSGAFQLKHWNENNIKANYQILKENLFYKFDFEKIVVEISNFSNGMLTSRFNRILGWIDSFLWNKEIELTPISPQEWRQLVYQKYSWSSWSREELKTAALLKVEQWFNIKTTSDDEAEAILIASAGLFVRTHEQVNKEVKFIKGYNQKLSIEKKKTRIKKQELIKKYQISKKTMTIKDIAKLNQYEKILKEKRK